MKAVFGGMIAAVIIFALVMGVSWIITCGLIKLITLCFGWTFSWGIATGIWLIMCLLNFGIKITVNNKK